MEFSKCKEKLGKQLVPEEPESNPSLSDSSSRESDSYNDVKCRKSRSKSASDSSDDSKYIKSKSKKRHTEKKRWKYMKKDSSDISSSDSDSYDESD